LSRLSGWMGVVAMLCDRLYEADGYVCGYTEFLRLRANGS
jgi:hypothetical protein